MIIHYFAINGVTLSPEQEKELRKVLSDLVKENKLVKVCSERKFSFLAKQCTMEDK